MCGGEQPAARSRHAPQRSARAASASHAHTSCCALTRARPTHPQASLPGTIDSSAAAAAWQLCCWARLCDRGRSAAACGSALQRDALDAAGTLRACWAPRSTSAWCAGPMHTSPCSHAHVWPVAACASLPRAACARCCALSSPSGLVAGVARHARPAVFCPGDCIQELQVCLPLCPPSLGGHTAPSDEPLRL